MSWFTNIGAVIITLLTYVGGVFGFFDPSPIVPGLPKQLVLVNTASEHQTDPAAPPPSVIYPGSQKPVESATTSGPNPHNLYNLPTPDNNDSFGCYEQQGDKVVVYLDGVAKALQNADVQTFQDLSEFGLCFGKDKENVYFYDQILGWADPHTFTVLTYFRGPTLLLGNGHEILSWKPGWLPNGTLSTEVSLNCTPGVSEGFCLVPDSDAKSFQTILGAFDIAPWAKDKNNVYCIGEILKGADPSTVELVNGGRNLRVRIGGAARTYVGCSVVDDHSVPGTN